MILPLIAATFLAATLPGISQPASNQKPATLTKSRSYIGLKYRDVPKGAESLGGWLLDVQNDGSFKYGVARVRDRKGEMLWLNRFIAHDLNTGKAIFQVKDVLDLPTISKSQVFAGHGFCKRNGKLDPDLAAIVEATDTAERTKIYRAWRVDRAKEKFEVISTKGIACENPAWGV